MPKNQKNTIFYINNYIDWDKFNQLYDPYLLNKGIENADAIACKLGLATTKTINLRLEEAWKKQKTVEMQKIEIIAAKRQRDRKKISLSSQEDENDIDRSDTDPDQEHDLSPAFL